MSSATNLMGWYFTLVFHHCAKSSHHIPFFMICTINISFLRSFAFLVRMVSPVSFRHFICALQHFAYLLRTHILYEHRRKNVFLQTVSKRSHLFLLALPLCIVRSVALFVFSNCAPMLVYYIILGLGIMMLIFVCWFHLVWCFNAHIKALKISQLPIR